MLKRASASRRVSEHHLARVAKAARLSEREGPMGPTVRVVESGDDAFVTRFLKGFVAGKGSGFSESDVTLHDGDVMERGQWESFELNGEEGWRRSFSCYNATFALTEVDTGTGKLTEFVFLFVSAPGFDVEKVILRLERHFADAIH